MSIDGRAELHRFAQSMLGAYLLSLGGNAPAIAAETAREFLESPRCAELINQFMGTLVKIMATELVQERRADPFRRLVCHPLTELLESGVLSRALLDNYFTFLHLVLGDSQAEMSAECETIVDELKQESPFKWDNFYDDLRAKKLLWTVLIRVAETFKRFEPRRDWFIGLMQNTPHALSLGSNMFIPKTRHEDDDQPHFGVAEFNILFGALFRPLMRLDPRDEAAFTQMSGVPPVRLVLPLVEKLV